MMDGVFNWGCEMKQEGQAGSSGRAALLESIPVWAAPRGSCLLLLLPPHHHFSSQDYFSGWRCGVEAPVWRQRMLQHAEPCSRCLGAVPELRDTKSTNTAQGLPWASGNSSQLSNTRTTEIQKFLWIKPPAWYKPNLQEPLIIQILGSIHDPWEEPCLEQAVLLSPFTKTWRIPSLSQPELHPPFQNQNFPAWLCLERALFAVHAGYFLFNLVILQN